MKEIVGTINIGIALWMTRYGLGWQAKDIDPESYADLEHFGPGTAFTTTTAGYVSKLSFFITLLRLVSGWQRKAPLWFFMITCCASYFVLSIIQPFYQCNKLKPWRTTCIAEEPVNAFQVYVSIYGTIVVSHVCPWFLAPILRSIADITGRISFSRSCQPWLF